MTLTTFNKLYQHYKDTFDAELILKATNSTYAKVRQKSFESDKYF